MATAEPRRRFQLILIKPSHYDDDGYVIRWYRAVIPSNSLAAMYGIAADCCDRQVLGADTDIDIEAIDETNTRVDVSGLLRRFQSHGGFGLVALVGVQSNQYPRALDIARPFREAGIEVMIGGFHDLSMITRPGQKGRVALTRSRRRRATTAICAHRTTRIDVKRSWQVSGMDDTVAGIAPLPERARGTAEAAQ